MNLIIISILMTVVGYLMSRCKDCASLYNIGLWITTTGAVMTAMLVFS